MAASWRSASLSAAFLHLCCLGRPSWIPGGFPGLDPSLPMALPILGHPCTVLGVFWLSHTIPDHPRWWGISWHTPQKSSLKTSPICGFGCFVPPKKWINPHFPAQAYNKDPSICLAASYSFCWFPHLSSEVKSSLCLSLMETWFWCQDRGSRT